MKKCILFSIIVSIVFVSCSNLQADNIRAFIPGVYMKEINDEFTRGMDTLVISVLDYQSRSYTIVRKTAYQQTIDGKALSPKKDFHTWIAIYIAETKQLREQSQGKVFSFAPDKNVVSMGSSEYKKISD